MNDEDIKVLRELCDAATLQPDDECEHIECGHLVASERAVYQIASEMPYVLGELEALRERLCERCRQTCYHRCATPWGTEEIEDDIADRVARWMLRDARGVDLTDPNDPVGIVLTDLARDIRAGDWRTT